MEIVIGYPPMYNEIAKKLSPGPRAIYAWGDKIYNPAGTHITQDLVVHEKVHMVQQAPSGPVTWWRRYLDEPEFLLSQEAQAYGRQYQYLCSQNHNRNFQFLILQQMALLLAGPMYGYVTNMEHAMELIRENA